MPEYGTNSNYPTPEDGVSQYDTHQAEVDVNASSLHHYAVRPVTRKAHPNAHGVFKVDSNDPDETGVRVALYRTYENATYVANNLNQWAGSEIN